MRTIAEIRSELEVGVAANRFHGHCYGDICHKAVVSLLDLIERTHRCEFISKKFANFRSCTICGKDE